jgi:predicted Fe-Mo cluster-binding NifX family protein
MRIGIPIWNGRVSPVLDTAGTLAVIETDFAGSRLSEEIRLEAAGIPARAGRIAELRLDLLVCGAVSRPLAELLVETGVPLCPWIAGEVDEVIEAAASGRLDRPRYRMPGCCGGANRRRGRGRARGGQGRAGRRSE